MNVQTARKFEDLLSGPAEPAPYDYEMMFKADGFFARQRAKKRFKLLKGVDAKLRRVLHAEERVYFMTTGTTVSIGEQFFVGWVAHYLNMRAIIFTTERVLLVAVDGKKRAEKLVSQIPYASIGSVKSTWTGICRIKLVNKETYSFQGVPKADRKFLAEFLADLVSGTAAPFQRGHGIEHLCPHCYTFVPAHPAACPGCSGAFKLPGKAALLSLLFPGLGDWYLGHRGFAVLEMFGAGFMWLVFVVLPLITPPDPELGPLDAGYWITVAVILLIAHGIDAMMTRHFALKGHHPHGKTPAAPPLMAAPPPLRG